MILRIISVLVVLLSISSASAQECLLTEDGEILSLTQFSGFNSRTYVNEDSDIFIEIGDLLVDMDGYAQTIQQCKFPKSENERNRKYYDKAVSIIGISQDLKRMPECLLVNSNDQNLNLIQSNKTALLFADNYYYYSHNPNNGIYVFDSKDGFVTTDNDLVIKEQCVIGVDY